MRILLLVSTLIGGGLASAVDILRASYQHSYPRSYAALEEAEKEFAVDPRFDGTPYAHPLYMIWLFGIDNSIPDESLEDGIKFFASLPDPDQRLAYGLAVEDCKEDFHISKTDCFIKSKEHYLPAASHIKRNIGKHHRP